MQQDKVLSMIGLARRANAVSLGEQMCSEAIKNKKARLAVIAENASENTKKSVKNSCEYYNVEYMEYAQKEDLGKCCGVNLIAALSVNDDNFADGIKKKFKDIQR